MAYRPMMLGSYRACGKLILLGEHFVVHGTPALAIPLPTLATTVEVDVDAGGEELRLHSDVLPEARALAETLLEAAAGRLGLRETGARPPWLVRVRSDIPVGFGLGSSAAFSVALVGALARATGRELGLDALNAHAHALEGIVHGNPSGIDDTVATYQRPLVFRRGGEHRRLDTPPSLRLVIASSGTPGSTREAVAGVGRRREADPEGFSTLLREADEVVVQGIAAFEADDMATLGAVLRRNHELLRRVEVSTLRLDGLVEAAVSAGALGAKMTGGGLGGMVVALVANAPGAQAVSAACREAGATDVWQLGGAT